MLFVSIFPAGLPYLRSCLLFVYDIPPGKCLRHYKRESTYQVSPAGCLHRPGASYYSFENSLSDPFVLPNGAKLRSLLYADDLVILSKSRTGLQTCLIKLSSYCNSWMLSINTKKTKDMIFQKRAKKCTESVFDIGKQTIEIVQNYTYLGTLISSTGNFKLALDQLKEKALHALFSLRKHTNISKLYLTP